MDRRVFLRTTAVAAGGLTFGSSFWSNAFAAGAGAAGTIPGAPGYGPLQPADRRGLRLPAGFTSRVVAVCDQAVAGTDYRWHQFPDGGACFTVPESTDFVYVSNSETIASSGAGASAIRFGRYGKQQAAYRILGGTQINCAGGPTPWGTWLSCEEFGEGQVWECDPFTPSQGVPRPALGFFAHEAVAVDPVHRHLYLTEDRPDGRLYRFTPAGWPSLASGRLEVARLVTDGQFVPSAGSVVRGRLGWVTVSEGSVGAAEPRPPDSTAFPGGEGCWYDAGTVYFTTKGDDRVYRLETATAALSLVYDPARREYAPLHGVDNVVVNRAGEIFVAEDGDDLQLNLLTQDRRVGTFLQIVDPDQAGSEITGPAFSPLGDRLYLSSQRARGRRPGSGLGITYEVRGPFHTRRR